MAAGWSLLCHQSIPQPRHYYAVKVVSGWGLGVSNGSEVTICGTWFDRASTSPSQVNSFLTESWRAAHGPRSNRRLFDNCGSENNTRQGDRLGHPKDFMCGKQNTIWTLRGKIWLIFALLVSHYLELQWLTMFFMNNVSIISRKPCAVNKISGWLGCQEWRNPKRAKWGTVFTFDHEFSEVWDPRPPGGLGNTPVKVLICSLDAV